MKHLPDFSAMKLWCLR